MKIFIEVGNLGKVLKYYANFIIKTRGLLFRACVWNEFLKYFLEPKKTLKVLYL